MSFSLKGLKDKLNTKPFLIATAAIAGVTAYVTYKQLTKVKSTSGQKISSPAEQFPQVDSGLSAREELAKNAKYLASAGKGLLASDEGTAGLGNKFKPLGVENTEENRRKYRELLYSASGIEKYISGVILVDESVKQKDKNGKTFPQALLDKGIYPGCGLDLKERPIIEGTDKEKTTLGLDNIDKACGEYYKLGVKFCKWRSVLRIGPNEPSSQAIYDNAINLAKYALICQKHRLVPIVEPDLVADGSHDTETALKAQEKVLGGTVKVLQDMNVFLEGIILKPSFIRPGTDDKNAKLDFKDMALKTVQACSRTVPGAVPGINFLSGGLSEEDASTMLNEVAKVTEARKPWNMSFTFGRALQNSAVKAWSGKDENVKKAQDIFITRCRINSEAQQGKLK